MTGLASMYEYLAGFLSRGKGNSVDGDGMRLKSDKFAKDPNKAWEKRKGKQIVKKVSPLALDTPIYADKVRFVCISDSHTCLERNRSYTIPNGDVLLHAGDLSMYGKPDEIHFVNSFLGTLPHPYKVVIAGNHDMSFDLDFVNSYTRVSPFWSLNNRDYKARLNAHGVRTVHDMMTNCVYLQDTAVEIYGIKIYGSPWSTGSGYSSWGFQASRGASILHKWNQIPDYTDILITHGPPCGHGDGMVPSRFHGLFGGSVRNNVDHVGCVDLLNTIQHRVRPKYHVFGHIHEGYGVTSDGTTSYVNAASCTVSYTPSNPPIIFDLPLPAGQHKTTAVSKDVLEKLSYRPGRDSTRSRDTGSRRHQADTPNLHTRQDSKTDTPNLHT